MSSSALTQTALPLPLVAKGKVRDVYDAGSDSLLFVATDRISAFDIVLKNGIPSKGRLLTALSVFWFDHLSSVLPNHLLASTFGAFPAELQTKLAPVRDQVEGRSLLVKKAQVLKIEAIVRGYLTGSGWAEYRKSGTVHGIKLPEGLVESQQLPEPLFTPSTKADQGEHDENIHPDMVAEIVGSKTLADQIRNAALALYTKAAAHARSRGIILADTKFEFGLLSVNGSEQQLILVDEVLTPDSSRFWSAAAYEPGKAQDSFDKQYVRDWLKSQGLAGGLPAGQEGAVELPDEVVKETERKYKEAYSMITRKQFE